MEEAAKSNVWLITGTSTGFGRCLVHLALARGDFVIATARSIEKIQDFPESNNLRLLQLDVDAGPEIIKTKIGEAFAFWGHIDVLVNNAGFGMKALFEEAGSSQFIRQFKTNVFGLIDVTTAVLPHMRTQMLGTIVMIGSRSSWKAEQPFSSAYTSSKAAVHTFSETLAVEVKQFNIRVLIVEPGAFRTEGILTSPFFTKNQISDYDVLRNKIYGAMDSIKGQFKGDPMKAMEVVVDVVRNEGKAKGRPWPLYLVLGHEAHITVREKCKEILEIMSSWEDITRDLNFDS